jgi:hypothetical protein
MLRVITWFAFAVCAVFGYFTTILPIMYYVFDTHAEHRSDYVIGWMWMTVYGLAPAAALLVLVLLQRRRIPLWLVAVWAIPAVPVFASMAFMVFRRVAQGDGV